MSPTLVFRLAWGLWLLSWLAAAFWAAPAVRRSTKNPLIYNAVIVLGAWLLFSGTARWLRAPLLWHVGYSGAMALALLTVAFFAFTWWARIRLGKLWSATITTKEDHRVIDTGPYAVVRHPIYTGIIGAIIATALAKATLLAIVGAALVILGLWLKARIEEEFLVEELGSEPYASYRARVPMLVPFGPRSR
jgi:protein-S-isoprenylcysteine O-methyltransferase Ste14